MAKCFVYYVSRYRHDVIFCQNTILVFVEHCKPLGDNRKLKGNLHFNKKITLNHRK